MEPIFKGDLHSQDQDDGQPGNCIAQCTRSPVTAIYRALLRYTRFRDETSSVRRPTIGSQSGK
jgi:hypothetical protein